MKVQPVRASFVAESAYSPSAGTGPNGRSQPTATRGDNLPLLFGGIALIGLIARRRMAARNDVD
jgi:hypothetical protein